MTIVADEWQSILDESVITFGWDMLEEHEADSVVKLKGIWKSLRAPFRRVKKSTKGKRGAAASEVNLTPSLLLRYYTQMQFLLKLRSLHAYDSLALVCALSLHFCGSSNLICISTEL